MTVIHDCLLRAGLSLKENIHAARLNGSKATGCPHSHKIFIGKWWRHVYLRNAFAIIGRAMSIMHLSLSHHWCSSTLILGSLGRGVHPASFYIPWQGRALAVDRRSFYQVFEGVSVGALFGVSSNRPWYTHTPQPITAFETERLDYYRVCIPARRASSACCIDIEVIGRGQPWSVNTIS